MSYDPYDRTVDNSVPDLHESCERVIEKLREEHAERQATVEYWIARHDALRQALRAVEQLGLDCAWDPTGAVENSCGRAFRIVHKALHPPPDPATMLSEAEIAQKF